MPLPGPSARRRLLWVALTGLVTLAARPPNLIFVTSDDHRWDALGVAGNSGVHTPVLDDLARRGLYLPQATVSVSQCLPQRATLLTGLPSFTHGVRSIQSRSPGAEEGLCGRPTVASLLAAAGYRTVLVGKWHVAAVPWECGFADVKSWLPGGSAHFQDPGLARGRSAELVEVEGYTQEIFTDDAVAFLRSDAARERPFLLWLALTAPHFPYEPNPARIEALYTERSDQSLRPPGFPDDVEANDWRHYLESVSHLDEQMGRVLAAVRDAGLEESTVVLFMGDNGYMMGERGIGGPGSLANGKVVPYESSLRVPFILAGPGIAAVEPSELPVSSLDVPPTLLGLAGVPVPDAWPGRDVLAAARGEIELTEAFAEWSDDESEKFGHLAFRVVRTPRWKLIDWKDPARADELYDLEADPREGKNLAGAAEAQVVLRDLRARLRAWMTETGDPALEWEPVLQVK